MPAEADSRSIPKDIPSLSYKNVDELRANLSEVLLRDAGSSLGAFKKDIDNFRRDRHNFEKPIEKIVVSEKATANDWLPSYLIRQHKFDVKKLIFMESQAQRATLNSFKKGNSVKKNIVNPERSPGASKDRSRISSWKLQVIEQRFKQESVQTDDTKKDYFRESTTIFPSQLLIGPKLKESLELIRKITVEKDPPVPEEGKDGNGRYSEEDNQPLLFRQTSCKISRNIGRGTLRTNLQGICKEERKVIRSCHVTHKPDQLLQEFRRPQKVLPQENNRGCLIAADSKGKLSRNNLKKKKIPRLVEQSDPKSDQAYLALYPYLLAHRMEAVPKLESDKLKAQKALNDKFRTTEYVRSNRLKFDRRRGETPHANLCGWETNEPEHAY